MASTTYSIAGWRWNCKACSFTTPLVKGSDHNDPEYSQELYLHNGTGIRYRWLFLVKSHLSRTRSILRTLNDPFWGPFGCIFCCAEGARSFAQVFESTDSLMEHLGSHHRFLKHSPLLDQTRSVIGLKSWVYRRGV